MNEILYYSKKMEIPIRFLNVYFLCEGETNKNCQISNKVSPGGTFDRLARERLQFESYQ